MINKRFRNNSKSIIRLNPTQIAAKEEVELKVKNKEYFFEEVVCPICNSCPNESQLLTEKDRYGLEYSARLCNVCGFVYVSPRMTQASYNKFYDLAYRRLYLGAASPSQFYYNKQYNRGKEIYNFIREAAFKDGKIGNLKVLEIGCSSGGIIKYFKDQNCEVMGVDLDTNYLEYGRENYGLDLIKGSLEDVPTNFKPDIIIYSHVLEHILDLNKELTTLRKLASQNTLLYIEVPGIKNIHNAYNYDLLRYFQNAHTFHFTLTSLTNIMNKFDFKIVSGNEFVKSIFIPETNNPKIENDYNHVLDYLKKIEKIRFRNQFKISTNFLRFKNFGLKNGVKLARFIG